VVLGSAALLTAAAIVALLPGDSDAQSSRPAAAITVHLDTTDQSMRRRAEFAARESIASYSNWLGPREIQVLEVTGLPWRSSPETMDVESMVAYEAARLWWRDRFDDVPLVDGIAWYLQSRVVEHLYDLIWERPGHSSEAVRFFGGSIPWSLPTLRLSRWNGGLARAEWRHAAGRWPLPGRRLPSSVDAPAIGVAMALASFEHAAGWPTVQAALSGAAESQSSGRPLADVLNDAAGLPIVTATAAAGDVAIAAVIDSPCADRPCRITRVVVVRDEPLIGVQAPLRIDFSDGQFVEAELGPGTSIRELVFESAAPYTQVRLDPDRTVLADVNLLNNVRLASPASNVPIAKWVARWMIWLEDVMLSSSALF
jgi:hypothetical protein